MDLKNQNTHSFINKKSREDGITVTMKLAWDKDIVVVVAEYSESFSESCQSAYQETSNVSSH